MQGDSEDCEGKRRGNRDDSRKVPMGGSDGCGGRSRRMPEDSSERGGEGLLGLTQQARQSLCDRVPCQDRAKPREAPKGTARMGRRHRAWERRRERPQAPQKSAGRRSIN